MDLHITYISHEQHKRIKIEMDLHIISITHKQDITKNNFEFEIKLN